MNSILTSLFLFELIQLSYSLVWYGNFANFSKWELKHSYLETNREVVNDPKGGTDKVLKVKYQAGSYSTGAQKGGCGFYVHPFGVNNTKAEHATFEYSVLFPSDFNFVKGGKLPGMFGNRYSCSGGDMALDCFTARFMFDSNSGGYAYLYVSKKANHTKEFCALTSAPNCSPDYGYGIGGGKYFPTDKWVRVKELIKLNTPGQPSGRFTFWMDDVKKFDFDKMIFRTSAITISGFVFETFFGGNTPDYATPKEVFSYFKNFKFETF